MNVNVNLFKSVAMRNGCNMQQAAKVLGVSALTLRRKMRGRESIFNVRDIALLEKAWDITSDEIGEIFFGNFVK